MSLGPKYTVSHSSRKSKGSGSRKSLSWQHRVGTTKTRLNKAFQELGPTDLLQ